jgi:hypothetical protein
LPIRSLFSKSFLPSRSLFTDAFRSGANFPLPARQPRQSVVGYDHGDFSDVVQLGVQAVESVVDSSASDRTAT